MSLFGALSSGVSGLTAQSSALGAISDNITNLSTVGYKSTKVSFQTLVTKQTSSTLFSPGGVQSSPRQDTSVQGLLQASSSQTDFSISGDGFFVVNESNTPTLTDQYLYTRAGSFFEDNQGFLRNTAGFYLQAWPTDASGKVVAANSNLSQTNQNIISPDFLETVNLSRVGGTASATTKISIGANLPSSDAAGTIHRTDAQFFDTLGVASTMSFIYTKTATANQWDLTVEPPAGTTVVTSKDGSGNVYDSIGQIEFTTRPGDGATVIIDGVTYEFDSNASVTTPVAQTRTVTLTTSGDLDANDVIETTINGTAISYTLGGAETLTTAAAGLAAAINANTTVNQAVTATSAAGVVTITSDVPGGAFTFAASSWTTDVDTDMGAADANPTANAGSSTLIGVDLSASTNLAGDVLALINAVTKGATADTDFVGNSRMALKPGTTSTVLFTEDGTGILVIDPSGLTDTNGAAAAKQTTSFTVQKQFEDYTPYTQFTFTDTPANNDTIVINGITYTFDSGETTNDGDLRIRIDTLPDMLADLEAAIEANDPKFAAGSSTVAIAERGGTGVNIEADTLVLSSLASGSYNVVFGGGFTNPPTSPDGTTVYVGGQTVAVQTKAALVFNSDGQPLEFHAQTLEVLGFNDGAADMDGSPANSPVVTLDFGTVGESNGLTQFGAAFTPVFITQNGSRFGTFAGVTIASDGLMTALFDNGEVRPIFRVPLATFVNPNQLEARTGNVFSATEASGDFTLREADNGPSGLIIQGALEASTVDIGEEFTAMIVVQRAYSASAKIISTADEMLEELMRIKR